MINIDSHTIQAFLTENRDFFLGARVQKIQQPNRKELILQLRSLGESLKFYININPSFYHFCFISKENEAKRNIKIPKQAAMFCMLLRKYIESSKIVDVRQPEHERILEIYFEHFDALNEKVELCLAIELMGKHSNIILYNADTNVIIGCAHNVGSEKSKERELAGMLPYIYPPRQRRKNLLKTDFAKFTDVLNSSNEPFDNILTTSFYDLTKPMVQEFSNIEKNIQNYRFIYDELRKKLNFEDVSPCISSDFNFYSVNLKSGFIESDSINSMIDDYFSFHQSNALMQNLKHRLFTVVNHQIKKLNKLKAQQEYQLKQLDKAKIYKKKGDILMANLYLLKTFEKEVVLDDYETNAKIKIELDTSISPSDNANRYYKLYKKTKASYEYAQERIIETQAKLDYFEEQKLYIEISDNINSLEDVDSELGLNKQESSRQKQKNEIKVEHKEFDGFKIYVGKNSKQNDYILSKVSSSDDLWFHPLIGAGAHVLLKKNNIKDVVPDSVLLQVAKLAKSFSSQKNETKVPIIYTLRKYVKKANSKGLAFVTYKNETEIYC